MLVAIKVRLKTEQENFLDEPEDPTLQSQGQPGPVPELPNHRGDSASGWSIQYSDLRANWRHGRLCQTSSELFCGPTMSPANNQLQRRECCVGTHLASLIRPRRGLLNVLSIISQQRHRASAPLRRRSPVSSRPLKHLASLFHRQTVNKTQGNFEGNFGGQVLAEFATKGALCHNGLEGKFLNSSGDIATATLATHDELFSPPLWHQESHKATIANKGRIVIHGFEPGR
jgi:hypothetical protein